MIISASDTTIPKAEDVSVTSDTLTVELSDGRTISVPLGWFPRLSHATSKERKTWLLVGKGEGVHWPLIDEDVGVEGLLAGRPSGEGQESFKKWLTARLARSIKTRGTRAKGAKSSRSRQGKSRKAAR